MQKFANFWRARSRLYQNEILQENMRLTAFFKLYKICILLHRCDLKNFAKNRFEKTAIFAKIQQKKCKCRKICKILSNKPQAAPLRFAPRHRGGGLERICRAEVDIRTAASPRGETLVGYIAYIWLCFVLWLGN